MKSQNLLTPGQEQDRKPQSESRPHEPIHQFINNSRMKNELQHIYVERLKGFFQLQNQVEILNVDMKFQKVQNNKSQITPSVNQIKKASPTRKASYLKALLPKFGVPQLVSKKRSVTNLGLKQSDATTDDPYFHQKNKEQTPVSVQRGQVSSNTFLSKESEEMKSGETPLDLYKAKQQEKAERNNISYKQFINGKTPLKKYEQVDLPPRSENQSKIIYTQEKPKLPNFYAQLSTNDEQAVSLESMPVLALQAQTSFQPQMDCTFLAQEMQLYPTLSKETSQEGSNWHPPFFSEQRMHEAIASEEKSDDRSEEMFFVERVLMCKQQSENLEGQLRSPTYQKYLDNEEEKTNINFT